MYSLRTITWCLPLYFFNLSQYYRHRQLTMFTTKGLPMNKSSTVTYSFTLDRDIYDTYKSIIVNNHENVKENLINYMKKVIRYETPNADTIEAIEEVEQMKAHPQDYPIYNSFEEILQEMQAK